MRVRRSAIVAAFALALSGCSHSNVAPSTSTTVPAGTRQAYAQEMLSCENTWDVRGPITGNCGYVPLYGEIQEDDPWDRWDCKINGNHICGDPIHGLVIWFNLNGELQGYELNAPDRPGCFVEPSDTRDGYEVIFYSHISGRGAPEFLGDELGFEVPCP